MRKLLFAILFISFIFGCNDSNDFYNQDKKDGKWVWFVPENSEDGEWLPLENNMIIIEDFNSLNGRVKFFYPSGLLESIQTYKKGEITGYYCSFYENQNKKQEGARHKELPVDTLEEWYENGQIKFKRYYENGKKQGKAIAWHQNGQVWVEGAFKDDLKNGDYSLYDINGQLREQGEFYLDEKVGPWKYFDENGVLKE